MTRLSLDASVAAKRKRRMRGMLIVLLAFLITLAAVVANFALHRVAEDGGRAEVQLQQLHALANRLSAFEWQAISERQMTSRTVASVKNTREEMRRTMDSLEQLDASAGNLRSLRLAHEAYSAAMTEEFRLLRAGDLGEARRVDEELVDPAFDVLAQALNSSAAAYRTQSKQAEQLAFIGSVLVLLLAVVAIGVLVWRAQKAQAATEAATAEHKALIRGQEELRRFADNVPSMTVSFDADLRCAFVNKYYADFFGFDMADVIGRHVREIIGEKVYGEVEHQFAQVLQGRPVSYQRTFNHRDGESRHLEIRLLPQVGDQGKVLGCFAVATDITEHKLTQERIQRMAHHDSLTGLPNRLLFNDRLEQAISLAKRDSHQFALLYLDLDRFKQANDSFGHAAGDELLQAVAARIRRQVRASDTVARVGGDEFTVILPDISRDEEAEIVASKVIDALRAPVPLGSQQLRVEIGASIGIALYPADGRDGDALVKAADAAMYSAKQLGNCFRFFKA